jgi:hypothetical protein
MDERSAREVVLVRAIETADGAREIWSDADRAWATRAGAEIVGEHAPDAAFIARRADLVLERLAERHPRIRALSRPPTARNWIAPLGAILAFVIGALGADISPSQRINLLAPPVLALLAWNLAVYAALVAAVMIPRRGRAPTGPLRQALVAWLGELTPRLRESVAPRPIVAAFRRFATDWPALALPLWQRRAARLLHVGAAMLAVGAIAGLYVRGIALEYRAAWQSTFLDAGAVAHLLAIVLAPGAWLTGIPVPDAAHLATVGAGSAGENAAPWIHLYAGTLLLVVVVPRLLLAAAAWIGERRLAHRFPLPLAHAYYQRLLHVWREGAAQVIVLPYSFDVSPAAREGLAKLLARVFDASVNVGWRVSTPYGDDALPDLPAAANATFVALFNLAATPEPENHGAFVESLRRHDARHAPTVAIVDTSDFVDRFNGDPRRVAEREAAWRHMLEAKSVEPLFVRLVEPDLREAAAMLAARLERSMP